MRREKWQPDAAVIDELLACPQRFTFFQAVRLLQRWLIEQGIAPLDALALIRFRNSVELGFAASDIEAIECITAPNPRIELTPAFMGLLGAAGALPLHDTERFAGWMMETGDVAPRAFLDQFSSRALMLFYRAWSKYRIALAEPAGAARLDALLLALAGIRRADTAPGLAGMAAALRCRVVSAPLLAGVLHACLQVPVEVCQFAGGWDRLVPEQQTCLGLARAALGLGATVGERLLRPELGICVRIGPLSRAQFAAFLPHTAGARALAALLGHVALELPYCTVQLVLCRADVAGTSLDGGACLGVDSFLCTQAVHGDRSDVCYPLAPVPA